MGSEIRSSLVIDMAKQKAQLKQLDSQAKRRDQRINKLQSKIKAVDRQAAKAEKKVARVARSLKKQGTRTAATLALQELTSELGLDKNAFGRILSQAALGASIAGAAGAITAASAGALAESLRLIKKSVNAQETLEKAIAKIDKKVELMNKAFDMKLRQIEERFMKELVDVRMKAKEEGREQYYLTASFIGGQAA